MRPQAEGEESSPKGQDLQIVQLAADLHLFHTPDREAFASVQTTTSTGHTKREVHRIARGSLQRYLCLRFYEQKNRIPTNDALQRALGLLEAQAIERGPEESIFTRLAERGQDLYLDLSNEEGEVIRVGPEGWEVTRNPPVHFLRPMHQRPLPRPEKGGSLDDLREFLNISEDTDFHLVCAWLLGALHPKGPYPILCLEGGQGSAKSTTARLLRGVIDPRKGGLRGFPKDLKDMAVAAPRTHILAFDNLSGVSDFISDWLCTVSTGGSQGSRKLFTDADEEVLEYCKPVILTGITSLVGRPDLAERCIILTLPPLREDARCNEEDFWAAFAQAHPKILGALLDAVSAALKNVDQVELATKPRMADFATWVARAESACPWDPGLFLAAYQANQRQTVDGTLQADQVASTLQSWMEEKSEWSGSASELLAKLSAHAGEQVSRVKGWPRLAQHLTRRLRQASVFLERSGIEVEFRKTKRQTEVWLSRKGGPGNVATSATAPQSSSLWDSEGGDNLTSTVGQCHPGAPPGEYEGYI